MSGAGERQRIYDNVVTGSTVNFVRNTAIFCKNVQPCDNIHYMHTSCVLLILGPILQTFDQAF